MTILSRPPTNAPSHIPFRIATLVLATILGTQCIWLLLAELFRPSAIRLPSDPQRAGIVAEHRNAATSAAWIGVIRGDLWAESAFTYANLLWTDSTNNSELAHLVDQGHARLDRAVLYAPHQTGAWLLLAGFASRYRWSKPDAAEALRMSYYTGPSELPLMPIRSLVAGQLPALDAELQQFVRRDLRVLTRQEKPAVIQAYQSATKAGKQFIEQAVGEIDPIFAKTLRLGAQ